MSDPNKLKKQIEALEDAIASGATKVKYADREVSYRTLAEMQQTLESLQRRLSKSGGLKFIEATYSSGLK